MQGLQLLVFVNLCRELKLSKVSMPRAPASDCVHYDGQEPGQLSPGRHSRSHRLTCDIVASRSADKALGAPSSLPCVLFTICPIAPLWLGSSCDPATRATPC